MAEVCKFYKQKRQVSYDCETWQDVTPPEYKQGDLYEKYSSDCGWSDNFLYRWVDVEGDYMCNGYDKYTKKRQEVSYNNGTDWETVPNSDRIGELVERFSSDCCQFRTVTGETCTTEDYRHITLTIEEASLDGETWVQTGCYTADTISEPYALECISGLCVYNINIPVSAATVYSEYINDKDNLIGYYDDYINIYNGKCSCGHLITVDKDMLPGEIEGQKLRKVVIPETCKVISSDAFRDIDTITEVTINSKYLIGGGGSVTLSNQFALCDSLTKVTFPDDYFGIISYRMFLACPNLTEVNLGNPKYIGAFAFSGTSLTTVYLGNAVTGIGGGAFATPTLTDVYIGQKENIMDDVSLTYNPFVNGVRIHVPCEAYGFWYKAAIENPTLGWNIEIWGDSGCTEMRWIESGTTCVGYDKYSKYIEQIKYGDFDYWFNTGNESAVTLIEEDSFECGYPIEGKWLARYTDGHTESAECNGTSAITANEINRYDLEYLVIGTCVKSLSWLSRNAGTSLTGVTMYDTLERIYNEAFSGSTYLKRINSDTDGVFNLPNGINSLGMDAFANCYELRKINIPSGVTSLDYHLFYRCTSLTMLNSDTEGTVNIPNGIVTIGEGCFEYCKGIRVLNISDSVTTIGSYVFFNCSNISSCTLGNSVVSIGSQAFEACSFTEIVIPDTVTDIGSRAFQNCSNLENVTCLPTTPPTIGIGGEIFKGTKNTLVIYVPAQSVELYKTQWSGYASRIQPIP